MQAFQVQMGLSGGAASRGRAAATSRRSLPCTRIGPQAAQQAYQQSFVQQQHAPCLSRSPVCCMSGSRRWVARHCLVHVISKDALLGLGGSPAHSHTRRACRITASAAASPVGGSAGGAQAINPFTRVVLPTALALLLCNMDRICLSVAIIPMSQEFGWPASLQVQLLPNNFSSVEAPCS